MKKKLNKKQMENVTGGTGIYSPTGDRPLIVAGGQHQRYSHPGANVKKGDELIVKAKAKEK